MLKINPTLILVQLDLVNKRETSDEKDVANKLDIDRCFETSSKDGRGIDEVVDFLLEEVRVPVYWYSYSIAFMVCFRRS